MSEYNAYGELYDRRPELILHDRLRNSGTAKELIQKAQQYNYKISFQRGPFRQDLLMDEGEQASERKSSHTLTTAMRYFNRREGWGR